MKRQHSTFLGCATVAAATLLASCATTPPPPQARPPVAVAPRTTTLPGVAPIDSTTSAPAKDSVIAPRGMDTTGVHPRPNVLIVGQNQIAVRTKLVPRVMGRGWTLLVNKPDSLEFFRPADSALSTLLFGAPAQPFQRVRLRFRLIPEGDGTRIALMGHLVGKDGVLPAVAIEAPLQENLQSLREDLLAAPPMLPPEKPRRRK